jgi:hypothetical protein
MVALHFEDTDLASLAPGKTQLAQQAHSATRCRDVGWVFVECEGECGYGEFPDSCGVAGSWPNRYCKCTRVPIG